MNNETANECSTDRDNNAMTLRLVESGLRINAFLLDIVERTPNYWITHRLLDVVEQTRDQRFFGERILNYWTLGLFDVVKQTPNYWRLTWLLDIVEQTLRIDGRCGADSKFLNTWLLGFVEQYWITWLLDVMERTPKYSSLVGLWKYVQYEGHET